MAIIDSNAMFLVNYHTNKHIKLLTIIFQNSLHKKFKFFFSLNGFVFKFIHFLKLFLKFFLIHFLEDFHEIQNT